MGKRYFSLITWLNLRRDKVNRQIWGWDFKNVDYFCPRLDVKGHGACAVTISDKRKCDQIFSNRNSVTDSRRIIKIGKWVRHEKHCT